MSTPPEPVSPSGAGLRAVFLLLLAFVPVNVGLAVGAVYLLRIGTEAAVQKGADQPDTPAKTEAAAPANGTDKANERKWAREVAELFLAATLKAKVQNFTGFEDAIVFACADFQDRLKRKTKFGNRAAAGLYYTLYKTEVLPQGVNDKEYKAEQLTSWSIDAERFAPAHDEAAFSGLLTGPQRRTSYKLVVSKEGGTGEWRVVNLQVEDR